MNSSALKTLLAASPPWTMGILNVTPDSFSDGGLHAEPDAAIRHAAALAEAGAHIIDVGGESTGPGSLPVDAEEEWRRIGSVIEAASANSRVSVDTYKAEVAEQALRRGASIINDVSALRCDPNLGRVIREFGAFVVLMHSKEPDDSPHASAGEARYTDIIADIREFLCRAVERALGCGIAEDRIIIDPGMGRFISHRADDSWELGARLEELRGSDLPFPLLISASRKGFLGGSLSGRDPLSQLFHLAAVVKGADIIRTHNPGMLGDFLSSWRRLKMV